MASTGSAFKTDRRVPVNCACSVACSVALASIIFEGSDFNALEILSSASIASVCWAGLRAKVATAGGDGWLVEVVELVELDAKEGSLRDLGTYPAYGCHFFAGGAAAECIVKDWAEDEAVTAGSFLGSAKTEEAV